MNMGNARSTHELNEKYVDDDTTISTSLLRNKEKPRLDAMYTSQDVHGTCDVSGCDRARSALAIAIYVWSRHMCILDNPDMRRAHCTQCNEETAKVFFIGSVFYQHQRPEETRSLVQAIHPLKATSELGVSAVCYVSPSSHVQITQIKSRCGW